MRDVRDKVAVITGAASGIGLGLAESFAAAGMRVVLSDIEPDRLDDAYKRMRQGGADVHPVVADVTVPEQVEQLAEESLNRYGAVHVLCNNAGVDTAAAPSWQAPLDEWTWVLGVNLLGVIHGVRTFLPVLLGQDADTHIVNVASLGGLIYGQGTIYDVSKAGVIALSEGLCLELLQAGLRTKVSVVCPAFVNTDLLRAARNRPAHFAPAPAPRDDPISQVAREWLVDQLAQGLDPREVGDLVLDAIHAERFYVFTHPSWLPLVDHRSRTVRAAGTPSPMPPPGTEELVHRLDVLTHPERHRDPARG